MLFSRPLLGLTPRGSSCLSPFTSPHPAAFLLRAASLQRQGGGDIPEEEGEAWEGEHVEQSSPWLPFSLLHFLSSTASQYQPRRPPCLPLPPLGAPSCRRALALFPLTPSLCFPLWADNSRPVIMSPLIGALMCVLFSLLMVAVIVAVLVRRKTSNSRPDSDPAPGSGGEPIALHLSPALPALPPQPQSPSVSAASHLHSRTPATDSCPPRPPPPGLPCPSPVPPRLTRASLHSLHSIAERQATVKTICPKTEREASDTAPLT